MTLFLRRVPVGIITAEELSSMLTHIHGVMICYIQLWNQLHLVLRKSDTFTKMGPVFSLTYCGIAM